MPRRPKLPTQLREAVRERANYLCEYCHALEAWQYVEFTMEHTENWNDHFIWSADGLEIMGQTSIGRATVNTLEFNRERARQIRAADVEAGRHPPKGDPQLQ